MTLRELVQKIGGINSSALDFELMLSDSNRLAKHKLLIDQLWVSGPDKQILILLSPDDIDKIYFGVNE